MPMTNPLNRLRELAPEDRAKFLRSLPANTRAALPYLWHYKARPEQRAPTGDWSTWLVMGGRGSGKTRAGAEWVRAQVEGATPLDPGPCRRVALLGETADQARDIMVLGDSGLIATSPPDRRPTFHVSRRHLIWPNGAEAHLFSASDPESLRGPQFDAAWCDELAKWKRTQKAWDMLQFGLRLGANPRTVVTTTPRANPTLIALMNDPATTLTQMPTRDNAANLAPSFLKQVEARYKGRDLGRQELKGELLTETPDAMWNRKLIAECQIAQAPPLTRIIVAVDPPVTSRKNSDACGIVAAGLTPGENPTATVLADWSVQGVSPQAWAERAVAAFRYHNADRLVAEVNQGGDMVEAIIRQIDPNIPFKAVRATRGKAVRAEPVLALYETHRVNHLREAKHTLIRLEDQLCAFAPSGFRGETKSPDRVDALVWAITELLLVKRAEPGIRSL